MPRTIPVIMKMSVKIVSVESPVTEIAGII